MAEARRRSKQVLAHPSVRDAEPPAFAARTWRACEERAAKQRAKSQATT